MVSRRSSGFTIVELLVVIAAIGIIAAISIVAYNGVQARARDNARREDVNLMADALSMYATNYNNLMGVGSGCGSNGNGNGWASYEDGGSYVKSIETCLKEKNLISRSVKDPLGPNAGSTPTNKNYAYMKYNCVVNGEEKSFIFAKLETQPTGDVITNPNVCNSSVVDTSYGMNYYVEVK